MVAALALGEAGVVDHGLPMALPTTPYARFGDFTLLVLALLCLAAAQFVRHHGRTSAESGSLKV
jgi:apolipoprotein N-acyltransferase